MKSGFCFDFRKVMEKVIRNAHTAVLSRVHELSKEIKCLNSAHDEFAMYTKVCHVQLNICFFFNQSIYLIVEEKYDILIV